MLILLRVSIGWHFLFAGIEKLNSSNFTADNFLGQAKGPLADKFHDLVHDWNGQQRLDPKYQTERMSAYLSEFDKHYRLNEIQRAAAEKILKESQDEAKQYLAGKKDDLATYDHDLKRLEEAKQARSRDVPFEQKRIWDKQTSLRGQLTTWSADLDRINTDFQARLAELRDANQLARGPIPHDFDSLLTQDHIVTYTNIAIGLCLMVGLFTRLAAFGGGLFLLSIVLAQPDWPGLYPAPPPSAGRTFLVGKEFIEMLAMFVLATTPVGRWGGLDFFIHHLVVRPIFGRKETT